MVGTSGTVTTLAGVQMRLPRSSRAAVDADDAAAASEVAAVVVVQVAVVVVVVVTAEIDGDSRQSRLEGRRIFHYALVSVAIWGLVR